MGYYNEKDVIEIIKSHRSYLQKNDINGFLSSIDNIYQRGPVVEFLLLKTSIPILKYIDTIPSDFLYGAENVKSIVIPGNINTIEKEAFKNSSLVQVDMEQGVQRLGNYVFANSKNLEVVNLSDTINTIPSHAFEGCTKLKKLFLPDSINLIGVDAFKGCDDVELIANYRQADKIRAKKSDYDFLKKHLKFTH